MVLGFGELADSDDEAQGLPKIFEGKPALDAMRIVEQLPFPDIRSKSLGLIASERGNAASARRAGLFRQGRHKCFPSRKAMPVAPANPFMTKDARARLDKDIEVVRRYTHLLNAEARVALAVRDAFDGANESCPGNHKIPTSLSDDGPLMVLTCAALEYTPLRDKIPEAFGKALEKWPVLRRQEKKV